MSHKNNYEKFVSALLKAELKKANVTYAELAKRLLELGIEEKPANIANKLSRGTFSAAFLIQCLDAIGVRELRT